MMKSKVFMVILFILMLGYTALASDNFLKYDLGISKLDVLNAQGRPDLSSKDIFSYLEPSNASLNFLFKNNKLNAIIYLKPLYHNIKMQFGQLLWVIQNTLGEPAEVYSNASSNDIESGNDVLFASWQLEKALVILTVSKNPKEPVILQISYFSVAQDNSPIKIITLQK